MRRNICVLITSLLIVFSAAAQQQIEPVRLARIAGDLYEILGGRGSRGGVYIGDDGVLVIDAKMTDSKDEDLAKFNRQLHAYKYALENPAEKEPITVSKMGLLIVSPTDIKPYKGHVYYKVKPIWKEVPIDMVNFFAFIGIVERLLSGPAPAPTSSCKWCQYKHG